MAKIHPGTITVRTPHELDHCFEMLVKTLAKKSGLRIAPVDCVPDVPATQPEAYIDLAREAYARSLGASGWLDAYRHLRSSGFL